MLQRYLLSPDCAETIRKLHLNKADVEHRRTQRIIRACPADQVAFRPHPRSKAFLELAFHIYTVGGPLLGVIDIPDEPGDRDRPPDPATVEEMLATADVLHERWTRRVNALRAQQLAEPYKMPSGVMVSGVEVLDGYLSHMIHHRGQLQTYLRVMGAKCPALYGPSGDVGLAEYMRIETSGE